MAATVEAPVGAAPARAVVGAEARRDRLRRLVLVAFVAIGAIVLLAQADAIADQEPLDLDINLVAGERLADRVPLYETGAEPQSRAVEIGGPAMAGAFTRPTNSFVGPPSTALVHVPFTWFAHDVGVALFRLLALVGMVASLGLVARALPEGRRLDGFLLGTGVLLVASATVETLQLGQGHELVMLGLAVALWGTARERWGWVGAGLALAALLKITPALLVVYLVVRGRRQVVPAFVATAAALTAAAAAVGRPSDLLVWVHDVAPDVSRGVVRTINQSLPGLLERLTASRGELVSGQLGPVRLLAVPLMLATAALLWRARRHRALDPLELGVLVLVALVAGPLTWMHYAVWATVPLVLLADPDRWRGRRVLLPAVGGVTAVVLLALPVVEPTAAEVSDAPWTRVTSSPGLVAVVVLLAVVAASLRSERAPG